MDSSDLRGVFETALRLASVEAPGLPPEIYRARATVQTWRSGSLVDPVEAERVRCEVSEAWLQETGQERTLRAGLEPLHAGEDVEDRLPVPRGHALPGEHPRRSGKR